MDMGVDKARIEHGVGLGTDHLRLGISPDKRFGAVDLPDMGIERNGVILYEGVLNIEIVGDDYFHGGSLGIEVICLAMVNACDLFDVSVIKECLICAKLPSFYLFLIDTFRDCWFCMAHCCREEDR